MAPSHKSSYPRSQSAPDFTPLPEQIGIGACTSAAALSTVVFIKDPYAALIRIRAVATTAITKFLCFAHDYKPVKELARDT
jgi:hypothetical protein